jgi:hypothetical protein
MIPDSKTQMTEQSTGKWSIYSTSDVGGGSYTWIQDPIARQVLAPTETNLIDGIYVQALPVELLIKQPSVSDIEAELDAMAADPDIQREIKQINAEFAGTEMDGLTGEV